MEAFEMDLATEGQSLYTSIDIRHPRSRALLRSPTRTSRSASAGMGFLRYQKEGSCRDLVADPGKTVGFGTCITHSFVQVFSLAQGPSQRFHRTERVRTIPAEAQDEAGRPHPCEPPCEHQRGFRRALRMDMATVRQPVFGRGRDPRWIPRWTLHLRGALPLFGSRGLLDLFQLVGKLRCLSVHLFLRMWGWSRGVEFCSRGHFGCPEHFGHRG